MPRRMIVKVQAPIFSSGVAVDAAPALVYDETRTTYMTMPYDETLQHMMNGKPKMFFYAEVGQRSIKLLEEAKWQEW